VVRAQGTSAAALAREFDDATPVAIITWGPDTAATATVQTSASGSPREQLSLRVARPRDPLPERSRGCWFTIYAARQFGASSGLAFLSGWL